MPDPCDYDNEDEFHSDCVSARQDEYPDEDLEQSNAICYQMWRDRDCKGSDRTLGASSMTDEKPDSLIYKQGLQSDDNPYEFVMSTATPDRAGDVVVQDWNLKWFRKNPIALWGHKSDKPIGTWRKVRVEEGLGLVGVLELAEKGTSNLIDFLRSMVEQRILRAISVGFMPKEWEPLNEDDPWGGYRLSGNELFEGSLVTVPMNPEALSLAKSVGFANPRSLFAKSGEKEAFELSAASQLGIVSRRPEDTGRLILPSTVQRSAAKPRPIMLSKKIEAKETELIGLQDKLRDIMAGVDGDISEEDKIAIDELNLKIEKATEDLDTLKQVEASLMTKATDDLHHRGGEGGKSDGDGGNQIIRGDSGDPIRQPYIHMQSRKKKGHDALATMSILFKAHCQKKDPATIMREENLHRDRELDMLVRAAQNPATTIGVDWAAPLVRERWGEFIELIRDLAVYPLVPGTRIDFLGSNRIPMPRNTGRGRLAGDFVDEGQAIPVREGRYDQVDVVPKKMAIISTFTKEIAARSIPAIQGLLQTQILEDTAAVMDVRFTDDQARAASGPGRPAGLQDPTETGAGNIVASTGATVAAILADTQGMLGRVINARASTTGVWLINPLRVLGLRNKQDAASGSFVFRAEIGAGTFQGSPYLQSTNLPEDVVFFVGSQALVHATDYAPIIDVSDVATVHMEDAPSDDLGGVADPTPIRSFWQTDTVGIKMSLGLDWRIVRTAGVQVLTGVAW